MATGKKLYQRIAGLVKIGGSALFVRSLTGDGLPKSGYHLPSIPYTGGHSDRELKEAFAFNLGSRVVVRDCLLPIAADGEEVLVFYCEEETPVRFPTERFEYRYINPKDFLTQPVVHVDALAAEKALLYLPLLERRPRKSVLTPLECDKIKTMVESLSYFSDRIPKKEAEQFKRLVNTEISYKGVFYAYRFLLKQYGANYYEYSDLLSHLTE